VQTFIVALNSDGHTPDCLASIADAISSNFFRQSVGARGGSKRQGLERQLGAIMTSWRRTCVGFP